MEKTDADRKAAEQELREATQNTEWAERRREELENELEKINTSLRDVRDDRCKGRDEERLIFLVVFVFIFLHQFHNLFPNSMCFCSAADSF